MCGGIVHHLERRSLSTEEEAETLESTSDIESVCSDYSSLNKRLKELNRIFITCASVD